MLELVVLILCGVSVSISLVSLMDGKNSKIKNSLEDSNFKNELNDLSTSVNKLLNKNEILIANNKKLEIENDKFKKEIKSLNIKVSNLEMEVGYLKKDNERINNILNRYETMAPNFKLDKPFTMKIVK